MVGLFFILAAQQRLSYPAVLSGAVKSVPVDSALSLHPLKVSSVPCSIHLNKIVKNREEHEDREEGNDKFFVENIKKHLNFFYEMFIIKSCSLYRSKLRG